MFRWIARHNVRILIVLFLTTMLSGMFGWYVDAEEAARAAKVANEVDYAIKYSIVETLFRTVSFFTFEYATSQTEDYNRWLNGSRTAALLFSVWSAGTLIALNLAHTLLKLRVRYLWSDHTIIFGATDNGVAFAVSEKTRHPDTRVVLVDAHIDKAKADQAGTHGFSVLTAIPSDPDAVEGLALSKAKTIVVSLPNDGDSLELAMRVRARIESRRASRTDKKKAKLYVSVHDRQLWRQLARSDSIHRTHDVLEWIPFNLSAWAARRFTWEEPLWEYAELRGQDRVHVVCIGYDQYTEALIGQLPAACVFPGHEKTAFTVLSEDVVATEAQIRQAYPQIDDLVAWDVKAFDPRHDVLTEDRMQEIETRFYVTAVVVCLTDGEHGLSMAVATQDAMRRHGRWKAPVYVRLRKCEGIANLLVSVEKARRFVDAIEPFGVEDRLCRLDQIDGGPEKLARSFHDSYVAAREFRKDDDHPHRSDEPVADWDELRETYRVANRRAVDHLHAKLVAAGYHVPKNDKLRVSDLTPMDSETEVNALAELEHQSWMMGRFAEGWRQGRPRDDVRKIHPDLVPVEDIDDATRAYDRDQIAFMKKFLNSQGEDTAIVRPDHWIGLIGKNFVTTDEAKHMQDLLSKAFDTLLAHEESEEPHLTIITPLAPGSDMILTEAALKRLEEEKVEHRLLVVETVPPPLVIEDYRRNFMKGGVWASTDSALKHQNRDAHMWAVTAKKIGETREAIIERVAHRWAIDLTRPDICYTDRHSRDDGYLLASDYIAARCQTIIAAHRPSAEGAEAKSGGTEDTLRSLKPSQRPLGRKGILQLILNLEPGATEPEHTYIPAVDRSDR